MFLKFVKSWLEIPSSKSLETISPLEESLLLQIAKIDRLIKTYELDSKRFKESRANGHEKAAKDREGSNQTLV